MCFWQSLSRRGSLPAAHFEWTNCSVSSRVNKTCVFLVPSDSPSTWSWLQSLCPDYVSGPSAAAASATAQASAASVHCESQPSAGTRCWLVSLKELTNKLADTWLLGIFSKKPSKVDFLGVVFSILNWSLWWRKTCQFSPYPCLVGEARHAAFLCMTHCKVNPRQCFSTGAVRVSQTLPGLQGTPSWHVWTVFPW